MNAKEATSKRHFDLFGADFPLREPFLLPLPFLPFRECAFDILRFTIAEISLRDAVLIIT
jgi:hypothetical protein